MSLLSRYVDRRIAAYQSDLIARQVEEVQQMYRSMRAWRHDYHNHIQTMLAMLDGPDEKENLRKYLASLNDDLSSVDNVLKTGNVMLDAILNSKLAVARARGLEVTADAAVPERLTVSGVDLCALIGNLLDNAIESAQKCPRPFARVYIGALREQLYISVQNAAGEVKRRGGAFLSTKRDTGGLGLARVDRIADKYGGYVNRQYEEGIFATEVLLPL